ncbi:MAG: hypothetical protein P4L71_07150 [Acetobacteraceae bacterium]|nr:hypothetical protein [Acetobacteraceae bacterium]
MPTSFAMDAIWLPVLLAIATVLVLAPGWLRRPRATSPECPRATAPASQAEPLRAGTIDVAAEVRTVLGRVGPEAERLFVRLVSAVQPGLTACAEPCAFRQLLADLVSSAVGRTPCGQVLLAAGAQGGQVQISVSDDGMVIGRHATESTLRGASQLIALQGGSLEIEMRPGEGTIATVRLAEADVTNLPVSTAETARASVAAPV